MARYAKIACAVAGCAVIASATGATLAYFSDKENRSLLAWQDTTIVARGKALYSAQCAGCHGVKGEGQVAAGLPVGSGPAAPPHDASGHTWQHPDFSLVQLTKAGTSSVACMTLDDSAMPKFDQALSDREILDVLSYIKSTWPDETIAEQEKVNRLYDSHNEVMWGMLKLDEPPSPGT